MTITAEDFDQALTEYYQDPNIEFTVEGIAAVTDYIEPTQADLDAFNAELGYTRCKKCGHRGDCVPGTGLDVDCLDEELEAEHDGRES